MPEQGVSRGAPVECILGAIAGASGASQGRDVDHAISGRDAISGPGLDVRGTGLGAASRPASVLQVIFGGAVSYDRGTPVISLGGAPGLFFITLKPRDE